MTQNQAVNLSRFLVVTNTEGNTLRLRLRTGLLSMRKKSVKSIVHACAIELFFQIAKTARKNQTFLWNEQNSDTKPNVSRTHYVLFTRIDSARDKTKSKETIASHYPMAKSCYLETRMHLDAPI